jgi:Ca2+/Na+ antiporter
MIALDILFAFVIALIYALLLIPIVGSRRVGIERFLLFFALLFLVVWAAAVWFRPLGPSLYREPWLVMLGLGAIFMLLLATLVQPWPQGPHRIKHPEAAAHRRPHEDVRDLPPEATALRVDSPESAVADATTLTLRLAFWVLIVILLGLIFGNYALVGR